MKRDKVISAIWGFLLSFGISTAGTMCLVTAFDFGVDTGILIGSCALCALIAAICYLLPLGFVPIGIGALLAGFFWQTGQLEESIEAILNRLSRQYDRAYGWGIIRWGWRTADVMEPSILLILCFLGGLLAVVTAWVVCRKKPVLPVLILSLLTIGPCFVVTDTVPDIPWLYIILLLLGVLLLTGSVRRQDEKQGNSLLLLVTPVAALALLVLFAVIPQDAYQGQNNAKLMADSILRSDSMQLLMGHLDDGAAAGSVSADRVDLTKVGHLVESRAQILEVKAPFTGTLYLRGRAMDTYDGVSWINSGMDYSQYQWPSEGLGTVGEVEISTRFAHRILYLPYYTDTMRLLELSGSMENETQLTNYSFACKKLSQQELIANLYPAEQSRIPEQYQDLLDSYSESGTVSKAVRAWAVPLASKICGGMESPYHKAQAIVSYVRNSAKYDTNTPRMGSDQTDFAKWFLQESETGYCVHFATATAVLLQGAGIPARYVTGYMTQVTEGKKTAVYSYQAHAWVEYWLPGFGWTILESTPPDYAAQSEQAERPVTEGTEPMDSTLPDDPGATAPQTPAGQQGNQDRAFIGWISLTVAVLCGLITAVVLQYRIRRQRWLKKLQAALPNQKALLYWQEITVYARLLKETPDAALYALAERAKFSPHILTEEQLRQFEVAAKEARQKLKKKNIFLRFYYRTILAIY